MSKLCLRAVRDETNGQQLFLATTWREGAGTGFDVRATDCSSSWQLQGHTPPEGHQLEEPEYMAACQDALCSPQPRYTYTFSIVRDQGGRTGNGRIKLRFGWKVSEDFTPTITLVLLPSPDHIATLSSMMNTLFSDYEAMRQAVGQLSSACEGQRHELEEVQGQLARHVEHAQEREKEIMVKLTLLINTKAQKIRQLSEEKQELLAEMDRMREELAQQGFHHEAREEDAGSSTPSRSGAHSDHEIDVGWGEVGEADRGAGATWDMTGAGVSQQMGQDMMELDAGGPSGRSQQAANLPAQPQPSTLNQADIPTQPLPDFDFAAMYPGVAHPGPAAAAAAGPAAMQAASQRTAQAEQQGAAALGTQAGQQLGAVAPGGLVSGLTLDFDDADLGL